MLPLAPPGPATTDLSGRISGCFKFMVSGCDGQCMRTSLLSPVSAWLTPPPFVTHVSLPPHVSPPDKWEHGLIAYIAPPVAEAPAGGVVGSLQELVEEGWTGCCWGAWL